MCGSRLYVPLLFLIYLLLTIPVRPVISKSTRSICAKFLGFDRTMAVDDQSEVSFSISPGTLLWQPHFLVFLSTELIFDTALASGMAKRAGTSLFPASTVFVRYSVGRALIHVGRRM